MTHPADGDADAEGGPPDPEGRSDSARPLDPADPRFTGFSRPDVPERSRELVLSRGPGASPMDVRVRIIRIALPLIALAGLLAVAAVFVAALSPGGAEVVVGDVDEVAAAVSERPHRVCRGDGPPCAWIVAVDGSLLAVSTSGPSPEEYGRQGVSWCPSSESFVATTTGRYYDVTGRPMSGPMRGLDRYRTRIDDAQRFVVDFGYRSGGPRADRDRVTPPAGPVCDEVPFDRDADLDVGGAGPD